MGKGSKTTPAEKKQAKAERQQRKAMARRHQILDAAMDFVASEGLNALTMAALAASADIAVGVIYRYFANKQELLAALQHRALELFSEDFREDLRRIDDFLRARELHGAREQHAALMRIIAASHIYLYEGDRAPIRHRMMNAALTPIDAFLQDDLAKDVDQTIQTILGLIERIMLDASVCGALTQQAPEAAWQRTYILWSHLHGLTHFRKRDRLQPPYLQVPILFQEGLSGLFLGWGASQQNIEKAFSLTHAFLDI